MSQVSDDVLSRLDVVDIVSRYVKLKRVGSNYSGLCPFHNEKTPSFVVSPQKQIFKCFGCGVGGNALKFYAEVERMDRWDAVQQLAKETGVEIEKYDFDVQKIQEEAGEKEKFKRLNKLTQDYFREQYLKNKEVQSYVSGQRKLSDELISQFGLGYAPDSYSELTKFLHAKGFGYEDLEQASLAKKSSKGDWYSFFHHRLTIPIWDDRGRVVGFGARALKAEDNPKYLNTAETVLYQKSKILYGVNFLKQSIKEFKKVIVVEGYMDVIALAKGGRPVGVATCGTAMTKQHMSLLKRYTEDIYLLFDRDDAGFQATIRALKVAYGQGVFPRVISLAEGVKDIDDVIREEPDQGKTKQIIQTLVDDAADGFWFVYTRLASQYDVSSPIEKQKLLHVMFELVQAMHSSNIQHDYLMLMADKLLTKEYLLIEQYKQFCKSVPQRQRKQQESKSTEKKPWQPTKRDLLYVLLQEDFARDQKLHGLDRLDAIRELMQDVEFLSGSFSFSEEEISHLQLWREQEFAKHEAIEEKLQFALQLLLPTIKELVDQHGRLHVSDPKKRLLILEKFRKLVQGK